MWRLRLLAGSLTAPAQWLGGSLSMKLFPNSQRKTLIHP
ncbi:hypothetical protein P3T23_006013 [Paraburkholderia sp. GAS448]